MIDSRSFSNECRRKIHRINSRFSNQVTQPMLDEYINESLIVWFRNQAAKFEINSEVRNNLRQFELKGVNLDFEDKGDRIVAKYPKNYYQLTNQEIIGSRSCGKKGIRVRIVQSGKLRDALRDPYWSPSFEWAETLGDESEDGLNIWHNKEFKVERVIIDYLREPKEFRCPSLMKEGSYKIGNKIYSKDLPLEVDKMRSNEISDLVALFVSRDLSDGQEYQAQSDKIYKKQTLYLN